MEKMYKELVIDIMSGEIKNSDDLQRAKIKLCRKYGLKRVPSNAELIAQIPERHRQRVLEVLRLKPSRTLSGVAVVAVMTSPEDCPHGKCDYCPGGTTINTPQSYTGHEPAAMRGEDNGFDPYQQVYSRLEQLVRIGHNVDKVDLIIMGGTFTARDSDYQEWFVRRCFEAMNDFPRYMKNPEGTLAQAHQANETAGARCIGLTVETRPDCFAGREVAKALELGTTRVELGVQTTDDAILKSVHRGHGITESIKATRASKDAGLKVCYHMMPGLPGATLRSDLETFKEIFTNSNYKPDMLKIYPTLVIKGTKLYDMWKKGQYEPYELDDMVLLVAKIKAMLPPWVRVQRIQRDIPAKLIEAGVQKSNLRQLARNRLKEQGKLCRCIRCREVGRQRPTGSGGGGGWKFELVKQKYEASGGTEAFISFEDKEKDVLVGYARVRKPGQDHHAFLRELKVLGREVPINQREEEWWQHKGYGTKLLQESELLVKSWGKDELRVTSGVGVRGYYKKHGYRKIGPYMVRKL